MKDILLALGILMTIFSSCEKTEEESTLASENHLLAEQIFNDVGRIVEEGFLSNGINKSCASYQLTDADTSDVDTLTIDFGTNNCLHNGKLRRGKMFITYTNKYRDSLAIMTTTFDKYYINNNLVEGERVTTNQGRNSQGNMWFKIKVNNARIKTTNNGTINWNATQSREWVSGNTTYFDITDDQYRITGSANGNAVNNNSFTAEITEALNIDLGCLASCVIKSGKTKITPNGYADRIINYGDGLCDCNFNITIDEDTYPIVVEH
jgi:hypothetical protein